MKAQLVIQQLNSHLLAFVRDRAIVFFQPVIRNAAAVLLTSVLISIALLLAETQFDRVSGENAIGAMVLASEARCEVGPNVHAAAQQHLELSGYFVTKIDPHGIAAIAEYLDEEIARNQHVTPAITKLAILFSGRGKSDDELLDAIHNFATEMREYGCIAYRKASFPQRRFGWKVRTPLLSDQDRLDIESAILKFKSSVNNLEKSPSFSTAQELCLRSRIAAAKLFLRWDDFQLSPTYAKTIESFKSDLDSSILLIPNIAGSYDERKLMQKYTQSLSRRRELLDKFREGNFQMLFEFLNESYDGLPMN